MIFFISKDVKELCKDMIDNCWDWSCDGYHYKNATTTIWIANGAYGVDFQPKMQAFNYREKKYIIKMVKKSRILKAKKKTQIAEAVKRMRMRLR